TVELVGVVQGEDGVDEGPGQHHGADGERDVDSKVRVRAIDRGEFGKDGNETRHAGDRGKDQDGHGAFVLRRCVVLHLRDGGTLRYHYGRGGEIDQHTDIPADQYSRDQHC